MTADARAPLPQPARVHDVLAHWAAADPDRVALVHHARRTSWGELAERVDALARGLLAHGVRRGDRVAVLGPPRPEVAEAFLAAASVGATFQGLSPRHTRSELRHVLGDAAPVLLLGAVDDPARLAALAADAPSVRHTVDLVGSPHALPAAGREVAGERLRAARAAVRPRDPAALVHTSGSSGTPKGALLPHHGLVHCALAQAEHVLDPGERPVTLDNLPVNHVGFLGDVLLGTFVAGGTVVLQERFDPRQALELIAAERVTVWPGVPTALALSAALPEFATADLSSVRCVVSGGGRLPPDLARVLRARVPRLVNAYGLTESVGNLTFTGPDDDVATIAGTVGRPHRTHDVRVLDDHGSEVPRGATGEICVRGQFLMLGYLGRPEETAAALGADGWLRTGDLAVQRPDGALVLVGRRSEVYTCGGHQVSPRQAEDVLERLPGVRQAAVVGVPDDLYGEVGHAFVVPDRPGAVDPDALLRLAREHLAGYRLPRRVTLVEALPLLPVGKVDRTRLAQRARAVPDGAA